MKVYLKNAECRMQKMPLGLTVGRLSWTLGSATPVNEEAPVNVEAPTETVEGFGLRISLAGQFNGQRV
jgi:hypothetical protein